MRRVFQYLLTLLVGIGIGGFVLYQNGYGTTPTAPSMTPTVGISTINAPSNLDALLENKAANTDPIIGWIRQGADGVPYLQWRAVYQVVTPTPATPSATPGTPSPSATLIPTNTTRPTVTPSRTPTRTSTPDDEATPTAEQQTETATAEPGAPKQCLVRNLSGGPFNIRADHVATATITGQVPTSQYAAVDRIWVVSTGEDEWFYVAHTRENGTIIRGWMHWTKDAGLLFGADDTLEFCWDVPLEGASATQTPVPTTAGPTLTPLPPVVLGCDVWNPGSDNLNVREGPGLSYAVIDRLTPGASGIALRVHVVSASEEWAHFSRLSAGGQNSYGYVALKIGGSPLATLRGDSCPTVPRVQALLVGWHTVQNFQWQWLASTAADYSAFKTTDLTKEFGPLYKSANPSGLWVHRSVIGSGGAVNCPTWEWTSPQTWINQYRQTWPAGAGMVETINECSIGPGGDTFNNFVIESTKYANSLGFCVLVFSFASGTPRYTEWLDLLPVLRFLDANPCRYENGKPVYNGIALHGAVCSGDGMMGNEWTKEPHICDRHVFIRDVLLANTGYDLLDFRGPIILTEAGIDAGYGGTAADPVWPTDKWLEVVSHTLDLFESEGIIDGIILWNLGDGAGRWVSREYWIEPLAELLRSRN